MQERSGYSAKVALKLLINGHALSLSHVGPSGMIVSDVCDPIPPCNAKLFVKVDDREEAKDVYLPNGVPGPGERVQYFANIG